MVLRSSILWQKFSLEMWGKRLFGYHFFYKPELWYNRGITMKEVFHFQPAVRKQYLIILILSGVMAVLLPLYLQSRELIIGYAVLAFLILGVGRLYRNLYAWQHLHKKLRAPFVTRILQVVATIAWISLVAVTFSEASTGGFLSYAFLWLVGLVLVHRFSVIFGLAKKSKKENPDRCEFC